MSKKIVFVLGAGFSRPAHAPEQKEILTEVLRQEDNPKLKNFLVYVFGSFRRLPLEDVFTALDKSLSQNDTLAQFEFKDILEARDALQSGIIRLITGRLQSPRPGYVNQFAERIVGLRLDQKDKDSVSILSTNWDILVDNALDEALEIRSDSKLDEKRIAFVDYCTYTRQLDENLNVIPPSNMIKASGFINLKLLKLHGSLNWLRCPNCSTLFVKPRVKIADELQGRTCRVCHQNDPSLQIQLRPVMITPTFVKDFSNVHLKQIWWNAGFELNEATHVVFIGYSLPLADFELRYLLARHMRKDSKIRVVLWSETGHEDVEADSVKERYIDFFGERRFARPDSFNFNGVEDYVNTLPDNTEEIFW